jgi:hypothetical protein
MAGACGAACVGLFDTAVSVILALAMLALAAAHGSFPVCIQYIAPVRPPPSIFILSRQLGGPRVLAGGGGGGSTNGLLLVRLFSSRFTPATTPILRLRFGRHLSCSGTACQLRFVCFLSFLCKYRCTPLLTRRLRPSGLQSISTILTIRRHTSA